MKAPFKYSGGKTREAKYLKSLLPSSGVTRIVEPFAGSCAFSFYVEKPALVSDVRPDVVTTLQVIQSPTLFPLLKERLDALSVVDDVEKLKGEFYRQRDEVWGTTDPLAVAYRFIVIRQLVFSGMDRINVKTGKENAPFGWYKRFSTNITKQHHDLMQTWEIRLQSFEETMRQTQEGDLVFLDPPYLGRNSTYGTGDPGVGLHEGLQAACDASNVRWLFVHCEHPFYDGFCGRHRTLKRDFSYSQNFKGRDNSASKTKHVYVMNYG